MSERSTYLRDQAAKCLRHAMALSDVQTQAELRNWPPNMPSARRISKAKSPATGLACKAGSQ